MAYKLTTFWGWQIHTRVTSISARNALHDLVSFYQALLESHQESHQIFVFFQKLILKCDKSVKENKKNQFQIGWYRLLVLLFLPTCLDFFLNTWLLLFTYYFSNKSFFNKNEWKWLSWIKDCPYSKKKKNDRDVLKMFGCRVRRTEFRYWKVTMLNSELLGYQPIWLLFILSHMG
jgi:hypothetical protein